MAIVRHAERPITRAEFDAMVARVAALSGAVCRLQSERVRMSCLADVDAARSQPVSMPALVLMTLLRAKFAEGETFDAGMIRERTGDARAKGQRLGALLRSLRDKNVEGYVLRRVGARDRGGCTWVLVDAQKQALDGVRNQKPAE